MVQVMDVAVFILSERKRKKYGTTQSMLQNLLYICQGWMLVARDVPLFSEDILADERGPVIREVERRLRSPRHDYLITEWDMNASEKLTTVERMLVGRVLSLYEECSGEEPYIGTNWLGIKTLQVIGHDSILHYFSQLDADAGMKRDIPRPYLEDISVRSFISENDYEQLEEYVHSAYDVRVL